MACAGACRQRRRRGPRLDAAQPRILFACRAKPERLVSPTINFFAALRNTTFPYVTQIGDDDTIFEDGILQALEMLEADRKLQAVAGNYLHYDFANDKPIKVTEFIRIPEHCTLAQF